jgi:hypothetical protein
MPKFVKNPAFDEEDPRASVHNQDGCLSKVIAYKMKGTSVLGIVLLLTASPLNAVINQFIDNIDTDAKLDNAKNTLDPLETVHSALFVVMMTIGLLLITSSSADIDLVVRQYPCMVVVLVLIRIGGEVADMLKGPHYFAVMNIPPLVYFLLRFEPIMGLNGAYPPFTTLFAFGLALELITQGCIICHAASVQFGGRFLLAATPTYCCYFIGGVATVWLHRYRLTTCDDSPSVALKSAACVFLVAWGLANLIWDSVQVAAIGIPIPAWIFIIHSIYLLGAVMMLCFRRILYRRLGKAWLKQIDETCSELAIPSTMGTVDEVEAAIKVSRLQVQLIQTIQLLTAIRPIQSLTAVYTFCTWFLTTRPVVTSMTSLYQTWWLVY